MFNNLTKLAKKRSMQQMSHQNTIKSHIFIASKGVGLYSDIWHYKKAKGLLQNIYLMLELS